MPCVREEGADEREPELAGVGVAAERDVRAESVQIPKSVGGMAQEDGEKAGVRGGVGFLKVVRPVMRVVDADDLDLDSADLVSSRLVNQGSDSAFAGPLDELACRDLLVMLGVAEHQEGGIHKVFQLRQ